MWKTLGFALLTGLAVPIGGISALTSVGLVLSMVLSTSERNFQTFFYLVVALSLLWGAIRVMKLMNERGKKLVATVNEKEGLSLNGEAKLGYPSPAFVVFDIHSRKLAVCNSATGDYKVHDFDWVLNWYVDWREVSAMRPDGGFKVISPTGMSAPTFSKSTELKDFSLVLEVADPSQPIYRFYMSRKGAENWCAKLNAIFS